VRKAPIGWTASQRHSAYALSVTSVTAVRDCPDHQWVYTKGGTYIHSNTRHIQLTGGTLSKCAVHECKGGTFHFGNVPGLAPTILGKDTCRHPASFLLPPPTRHHPSLQPAHPHVKSASKYPPMAPTTRSIAPPTNSSLTGSRHVG
jgi:hypothetical protein